MTTAQAFWLGLIQGITEFLPVSSSGHLVLGQLFFGFQEPAILFTILVHVATLVAVLVYFHQRLLTLKRRDCLLMTVGTIPVVFIGLYLKDYLEVLFSSVLLVAVSLLVTALLLWLAGREHNPHTTPLRQLSFQKALYIGVFQSLAIIPGISRSGATVASGLLNGLSKTEAFFFSFLLSIPAITGATILELARLESLSQVWTWPNGVGFVTALVSGLVALKLLDLMVHHSKLHFFALYCLVLGLGLISYQVLS